MEQIAAELAESSSVRNRTEKLVSMAPDSISNYMLFMVGRHPLSPLAGNKIVIQIQILGKSFRNQSHMKVRIYSSEMAFVDIWVSSTVALRRRILGMTDKVSFSRSCFIYDHRLGEIFRLAYTSFKYTFPLIHEDKYLCFETPGECFLY